MNRKHWIDNLRWVTVLLVLFYHVFYFYMTRNSFGVYILHYLVIAALGYMMKMYTNLAPWMMYVILFVAVMTIPFLLNEIIKRIPFIRWCVLGIKKEK